LPMADDQSPAAVGLWFAWLLVGVSHKGSS
jgi:hypothetical protein